MQRTSPGLWRITVPALLCALGAMFLSAHPARAAEKLVPARFGARTDKLGYVYTLDRNGRVRVPFGWLYSATSVSRGNVGFQQMEMTPNGEEFVLTGRLGQLQLTRRLRVSSKFPGIRIVEVLHNPTTKDIKTTFVIHGQANWPYQQLLTDQGRAPTGQLKKKEGGIVCEMKQPMQALVCFQLATPRTALKPTLVISNNHRLQFQYAVTVPAGQRVSIVHGATILPQKSMPTPKSLPRLFQHMRSPAWLRDLPKEIRSTLVNARPGGDFGGTLPPLSLEATLDVQPGSVDRLALGEETLLQGTATCERLTVEGAHGETLVPFSLVAALVGPRAEGYRPGVYLRDGQRLTGRITTEALRFEMTSGMAIDLDLEKLDRLVLRESKMPTATTPEHGLPARTEPYYLIETFRGDRLRSKAGTGILQVATNWGELKIPLSHLERIQLAGTKTPGHWVWLADGSRFRAFLRAEDLELTTERYGTIQIPVSQLLRIRLVRPGRSAEEQESDRREPHLRLAGGALLMGRIQLDALHFLSPAGIVPQPPNQIRLLQMTEAEQTVAPGAARRFRADIWGGGHLTGELKEFVVPVQTARGVLSIPVQDIQEVHVPTPVVPLAVRTRLSRLIADLGHDLWEKREAASAALKDLGELARLALDQALQETNDPEVERRVRRLLDRL